MRKIKRYLEESYNELIHKVTWPKWSELQGSSVLVMVASLIFAMIIFVMDFSLKNIMHFIYNIF